LPKLRLEDESEMPGAVPAPGTPRFELTTTPKAAAPEGCSPDPRTGRTSKDQMPSNPPSREIGLRKDPFMKIDLCSPGVVVGTGI